MNAMQRTIYNPVLQETVTFTKMATETGGALSELEITLKPQGGNPAHHHRGYAETFTALDGELTLILDNKTVVLQPGESYEVKGGVVHRFFNATPGQIRFRNEVRPGHTGLENSLRILSGLAADGLYDEKKEIPKHLSHLAMIGMMSDMRLPGAMFLTTPVLKVIAALARRHGIEQDLVVRYCR